MPKGRKIDLTLRNEKKAKKIQLFIMDFVDGEHLSASLLLLQE